MTDIGFDFGVLNNRLYGTFDWFNKQTEGILIQLPSPLVHGAATTPTSNAAQVTNKGFEVSLGWRDQINDFSYSINGNYTYVTNNVDKFKGKDRSLDGIYLTQEGEAIGSMYMYEADRIIQTDEDLAIVNNMIARNPDAFSKLGATPEKGDILFKDLDGDGIIDPSKDRKVVGSTLPKHTFGLTLSAAYKGVDLSIFMQGVAGAKGYLNEKYFGSTVQRGYQITKEIAENSWVERYDKRKIPASDVSECHQQPGKQPVGPEQELPEDTEYPVRIHHPETLIEQDSVTETACLRQPGKLLYVYQLQRYRSGTGSANLPDHETSSYWC